MKTFYIPVSMWVKANSEEEADEMLNKIKQNIKETTNSIVTCHVTMEYHLDSFEER